MNLTCNSIFIIDFFVKFYNRLIPCLLPLVFQFYICLKIAYLDSRGCAKNMVVLNNILHTSLANVHLQPVKIQIQIVKTTVSV